MTSLREIRRKIKSIKGIQQITRTMKMISAARLARAQTQIIQSRPFANRLKELVKNLSLKIYSSDSEPENIESIIHQFYIKRNTNKILLIVVSADKGLCGAFNISIIQKAVEFIETNKNKNISLILIGKKCRDYFYKLSVANIISEYINIFKKVTYAQAEIIGNKIIKLYLEDDFSDVYVIYNEFKSVMSQKIVVEKLLPIETDTEIITDQISYDSTKVNPVRETTFSNRVNWDFIYEPEMDKLLDALFPRQLKAEIYRILLESISAELAARLTAMDNATNNADDLVQHLILVANKVRQTSITKELAELIAH